MIDAALARSPASDVDALVDAVDAVHAVVSRSQRELLRLIAEVDRQEAWRGSGARDTAHWLSMRYGVSSWKAHRWIGAAYALERLPRLAHALAGGDLAIDKVVELARFATPSDEAGLVRWAAAVSCATIRRRADRARDDDPGEARETERSRSLSWWWVDDGRRLGLEGELPAAQGAVVVRALERTAERVPEMPDERGGAFADARRADALVALCSSTLAADATNDPDRATVVLHARVTPDGRGVEACEVDGGAPVPRSAVERPLCDARVEWSARTTAATSSRSGAPSGSRPRGCSANSGTGTAGAVSPAAGRRASRRRTMSDGGAAAAAPNRTTSS
ncbi:MAG TPA: DUF222 domain-containing protein [Actinomycetota bacterium]